MNSTLLKSLGISVDESAEKRKELLEMHQMSLLSMRKIESDQSRIEELTKRLHEIDAEIDATKREIQGDFVSSSSTDSEQSEEDDANARYQEELARIKNRESLRRQSLEATADGDKPDKTEEKSSDEPKETQPTNTTVSSLNSTPITTSADKKLQEAKQAYNQRDYNSSFVKFQELANEGNSEAMFWTAKMYRDGVGTKVDSDRYAFWLKKSADAGITEAEYTYALLKISRQTTDSSAFKEGMKYLQKAADSGYVYAIEKYIELAAGGNLDPVYINKAIQSCAVREGQQTDAFEKNQYSDKANTLRGKLKEVKKTKTKNKTFTTFRILGPILLVLGCLYWFGGLHPEEWEKNQLLKYFPSMSKYLIIPIKFAWEKLDTVVSIGINGKFGVQLIAIAFILIYISMPPKNEKYALKSLYTVAKVISIVILVWHWLMQLIEDMEVFDGMIYYIITFLICFALGKIIGMLYKKITKAK